MVLNMGLGFRVPLYTFVKGFCRLGHLCLDFLREVTGSLTMGVGFRV